MRLAYFLLFVAASAAAAPNGGVLDNDTDPDWDAVVSAVLVDLPQHGTLQFNPDGTFVYTPNPNWWGGDTFTYRPVDETGMEGEPTLVTITVRPKGDPPVGVPDNYETDEDTPLIIPPPVALTPGDYRVATTWPEDDTLSPNALFTVLVDGKPNRTVVVDQRKRPADFETHDGFGWKVLTERVRVEESISVVVSKQDTTHPIQADALRVERYGP